MREAERCSWVHKAKRSGAAWRGGAEAWRGGVEAWQSGRGSRALWSSRAFGCSPYRKWADHTPCHRPYLPPCPPPHVDNRPATSPPLTNPHATSSDNSRQVTDPIATTDENTRRGLKVRMRKAVRKTAKGPHRGGGGGFWGGVQPTRRPGFCLFAPNNNEGWDFPPAVLTKETGQCATHIPPLINPTICC